MKQRSPGKSSAGAEAGIVSFQEALDGVVLELTGQRGERIDDLAAVHGSNAVQGTLRDEDAATPEGRRGLGDRNRTKTGHLADEPEAIQEARGLDRPFRPTQIVDRREVLGQGTEVGVVAGDAGRLRPLCDGLCPRAIVSSQRELVEELAHCVAEVLARKDTLRHPREGL